MDSLNELFALAVFLAVAAVFLWMLIGGVQNIFAKKKQPDVTVVAEVSKKFSEVGTGEFKGDGVRLGKKLYRAEFRCDSGETFGFVLSQGEYDELHEGERGHLTYREKTFLSFVPDMLA